MTLLPGTRLGPYEIVSILGSGGMGEVYRARDSRLQRDVAVKVLPDQLAFDAEALGRFQREARAIAALTHPNIRAIFDFGSEGNVPYAVGEFLQGMTLRTILARERLPIQRCVGIATAIADGLAAAHAKGIVHRDVKPENIFITDDGQVKILDFGLARTEPPSPDIAVSTLTTPGIAVGTVGYMAPEQIRGRACGMPCDVFALGCVLYEMLTGAGPFTGESHAETTAAVLRDVPRLPDEIRKDVPEDVSNLVMRCLAKDPAKRFPSAIELADELHSIQLTAATERYSTTLRTIRRAARRRQTLALTVCATLVVAAIVFAMWTRRSRVVDDGYALHVADVTANRDALRLFNDALHADAAGNRPQAVEMLAEAARLDAAAPLPRAFLASFNEASGNHTAAARWANEAMLALHDGNPPYEAMLVRYLVGPARSGTRSPLGGITSLLQLRPQAWRLRLALAHYRLARREQPAALQELQSIDVKKLDDRRVALVIADRASLGDVAGAEAALRQSALLPGGAIALYANGRIAWSKGDAVAAGKLFDRCVDRATIQDVPDIALEARLLGGIARIGSNNFPEAERLLGIAATTSRESQNARDEFSANVLAAYAADRAGDTDARDHYLAAADALTDEAPAEGLVTLHDLAMRMHSAEVPRFHAVALPPGDWSTLGAASLLAARQAFSSGDRVRAAKLLTQARREGVDSVYLAENAALLDADLGAAAQRFRPDPPYPNLPRYVAIWELNRAR